MNNKESMQQTNESPAERLQRLIAEDNLIRNAWTDGQHRACLLAAMAPQCGAEQSAAACPADVMPLWLAHLTPSIDDKGSASAWPAMVRRYASVAARWPVLDAAAWERLRLKALSISVTEARSHVTAGQVQVLAAIDGVLEWLAAGALEEGREKVRAKAAAAAAKAAAAGAAAAEAAWAAWAAWEAWDRMTSAILGEIKAECSAAEAA